MRASVVLALATSVVGALVLADTPVARACGCLSPPAVSEGEFAVNQEAEQIIFEVEPGWVTAHVLIKYAGDPSKFAWIIPVPEVPELGVSPVSAFGLLDQQTAPDVTVQVEDVCPISQWACAYHDQPSCPGLFGAVDEASDYGFGSVDAGFSGDAGASTTPVTVIDQQVVGDYQTITFRANEAAAATQWLRDNGFVVNQTTSIYMESYVNQNMVFVAAKLVPGAGIKAIKPLRMRYRAAYPMVPLILTAVAAEPNLTVTTFVYANQAFRPMGHPVVSLDEKQIARDTKGRPNYPMALARAIDEAGGDAFAIEYRGPGIEPAFGQSAMCCGYQYDVCNLGYDNQCQCPGDEYDANDCASEPDLVEGVGLLKSLAAKYSSLTRITTRVSAEEMTFDPTFEPDYDGYGFGRLTLRGTQASLANCSGAVLDHDAYIELDAKQSCAATYCGPGGRCVVTTSGPACACNVGYVAQRFTDLDSAASVTCVPRTPPVDLRANGEQLPDACATVSCGTGSTCIDRNGVAVCACGNGKAAAVGSGSAPHCDPIVFNGTTSGGEDYSDGFRDLEVCAPAPPTCYEGGWLVKHPSPRPGVSCGNNEPPESLTHPGPKPTCSGVFGCGCQQTPSSAPVGTLFSLVLVGFAVMRRRRTRGQ
jgi:MYXO-CTERM domain-containing protein